MPCGYNGKIAIVNLPDDVIIAELDFSLAELFVGGRGLATKILYDELKPRLNPFSKKNMVIFSTGPLTASVAATSGRFCVSSKSPLTNTIFHSNAGGFFGVELKRAGFDALIIKGKAENPVYILLEDDKVEVKDASKLWGKSTKETKEYLSKKHNARVSCIGPAGENLVRFACLINDEERAAGRGGLGAVLGYKKVKAIVAKGKKKIEYANEYALRKYARKFFEILKGHPVTGDTLKRFGTAVLVNFVNKHGILPIKNFNEGFSEQAEKISGETLSKYLYKHKACYACPIQCGRLVKIEKRILKAPEYESIWALGPQCYNFDLKSIAKANELCNLLGLDTISTGNAIGFAMECCERGLIEEKIRFGDKNAIIRLVKEIAYRKGIGNLLAEGVARTAEKLNAKEFACHVKGLELPAYDPRGAKGQALSYATSNIGGTHLAGYIIPQEVLGLPKYLDSMKAEGKAKFVKKLQDIAAMLDSLIICKYTTLAVFKTLNFEVDIYAKLLTAATGFYFDEEEFLRTGERIYNLERLFNVREGFDARHDTLPERFLKETMRSGPTAGQIVELKRMLEEYYTLRGWIDGIPSEKKMQELNLLAEPIYPKLQVALDIRNLSEAVRIAKLAFKGGAEWVEAGTPLIKKNGMHAVERLRQILPYATIIADMKTMDTGYIEVEMAAEAGADIVAILGVADDETIRDAIGAARKYNVKVMVDLIGVKNCLERAKQLEKLGVDYLVYHVGVDKQLRSEYRKIPFGDVKKLAEEIKIPLAVAGGIRADTAELAVKAGAKIIIVGSAIVKSANPEQAAREIFRRIRKC